jgi:hypothetical protein
VCVMGYFLLLLLSWITLSGNASDVEILPEIER